MFVSTYQQLAVMQLYGKRGRLPTSSLDLMLRMVGMGAAQTAIESGGANCAHTLTKAGIKLVTVCVAMAADAGRIMMICVLFVCIDGFCVVCEVRMKY